jgi:hypothetical protein
MATRQIDAELTRITVPFPGASRNMAAGVGAIKAANGRDATASSARPPFAYAQRTL